MKLHYLILLMLISASAFAQNESAEILLKVIYKAGTRGKVVTITADSDSIRYRSFEGTEKYDFDRVVSDSSFKMLNRIVFEFDLQMLNTLKSPTHHRGYDGDWYTSISIVTTKETYSTTDFDRMCPMDEIKPLLVFFEEALDLQLFYKDGKRCNE